MASTSNDDGSSQSSVDGNRMTPEPPRRIPPLNNDDEDGNALGESKVRINPEVLRGVPPLDGLDKIEVVLVQPAPFWARWTEGLVIHVVGSGVVAVIAFTVGLMLVGPTMKAENAQSNSGCVTVPAPDKAG